MDKNENAQNKKSQKKTWSEPEITKYQKTSFIKSGAGRLQPGEAINFYRSS